MVEPRPIPTYHNSLGDFVCDLRIKVFRSQEEAARYVGCDRSTVSRYESGKQQAPLGYLALFAQCYFTHQGLDPQADTTARYQQALLAEVNRVIAQCYEYHRPLRDWGALVAGAAAYQNRDTTNDEPPVAPTPQPNRRHLTSWSEAPDVTVFYGREIELQLLHTWVLEQECRLIGILGIGGVGKTMLATKLLTELAPHFDYIIWRTLRHEQTVAELLADFIHLLSGQAVTTEGHLQPLIDQFLHEINTRRCLFLLDNVESILQSGEHAGAYRPEFANFGHLFRLVAETSHQSCLVLTSREKPREVARLEGVTAWVRSLPLAGVDVYTARAALDDKALIGTEAVWRQLVDHFSGNLMAMQFVAESIRDLFDSNIARFLDDQETTIFSDVRALLDQQFQRLLPLEQSLLYWFAIERDATGIARLQENLVPGVPTHEVQDALQSLRRRSLVEQTKTGFTLQTIVLDYMTQRFVEQVCAEIRSGPFTLFHSHALLKAQAKDYVRQVQTRLIVKPIADGLLTFYRSQPFVEQRLITCLEQLRTIPAALPNYAGGNIFNLLSYLKTDLRHFDFSHIAIWQAYMVESNLQDTNFAHADLHHSLFLEVLDRVRALAFSHAGRVLAAGITDGEIRLWQPQERHPLLTFRGHTDWVRALCFSPDDQWLYSCGDDAVIKQWDVNTGQCLLTLRGHIGRVTGLALSPSGNILASSAEDRQIHLWDTQTGQLIRTLPGHGKWVWTVAFSPDGRYLASSSSDHTVRLWDVGAGLCLHVLQGHTSWVWGVAFSPDGQTIASCGHDGTIRLWDAAAGVCRHVLTAHTGWVWCVTFQPVGGLLASGSSDRTIRLWDVQTGELVTTLHGHTGHAWTLAFSPDGHTLVSGSEDRTVRLWDMDLYQPVSTLYGYNGRIAAIGLAPHADLLASGGEDQLVRLWDLAQGMPVKTLRGHTSRILSVAFSPDGRRLVSGSADKTARLWDSVTGQCLQVLHGHASALRATFSPDGRLLATGSFDTTIRLWDAETGSCLDIIKDVDKLAEICTLAFAPNGRWLAIGCEKGSIWLYELATAQLRVLHQEHSVNIHAVLFSQDNHTLISSSTDGKLCFWSVDSGELRQVVQAHQQQVRALALNGTETILASGSHDQTICLWELPAILVTSDASPRPLRTLTGHTGAVFSLVFHPNGTLISGSQDETIRIWDDTSGVCLQTLHADRIYERMNITGATGLTPAQRTSLVALGAVEG